jgi:phytoene dehydrogenase-like protein
MAATNYDAIVIGAGHNGLVAANVLADAGWQVLVVEGAPYAGGAVHSDDSLHPGFVTDQFSAFYPLGAASPVLRALELAEWGLAWSHAPAALAHVLPDDRCATLSRDVTATAASLDTFAAGDGDRWSQMFHEFDRVREPLLDSLLRPFPPVRPASALLRRLGAADALRFARFAVQPVRRYAEENFRGEGAGILLAGNALHTDLAPENAGSAIYGWLLCMLAQSVGFPVPVGGSGRLTAALVARLESRGGQIRLSSPVERITVGGGQVGGVRLVGGEHVACSTVLTDVAAPTLYRDLIGLDLLPRRLADDLDRFQWDAPTLKLNWALSGPLAWTAPGARGAGTVHLGADLDGLTRYAADLSTRQIPDHPFLLFGQMTTADPSRSPADTESAWAYTHLPSGRTLTAADIDRHVERIETVIEAHAPGFRNLMLARSVQGPRDLNSANPNLVGGAVGGGTSALHQQLIFRPTPGLGRAETPIDGLYLAGSAAHPGGGVHGAAGANAARAALLRHRATGGLRRRGVDLLFRRIYANPPTLTDIANYERTTR